MKIQRIVVFLFVAALAPSQSARRAETPDGKEIKEYRLNMDVIQRYLNAYKMASNDAGAKKCFDNSPPGNAPTLDAGEKLINACPAAVAIIKNAGLKPREFLVITGALIADYIAVGMKRQGTLKQYPASISPENAAFIDQNFDKLQTMMAPLTQQAK
jgi:hypothetical protein